LDLKEKAKQLPVKPGVYLMKDSVGNIIYVGKSKALRSRVSSYFQNSKNHPPKVVKMVRSIKDFDFVETDTEFEAFLLECSLIKNIKPMFNKKMKNNETYTYVEINTSEIYPSIVVTYEIQNSNSLYFGPYSSKRTVENAIEGIKEHFRILCRGVGSKKTTGCLNYSLGLCMGICKSNDLYEEYNNALKKIIHLLQGKDNTMLDELKNKMDMAAENLDFTRAAKYRDYINGINYLINKQDVVSHVRKNQNIAAVEYIDDNTFKIFLLKGSKVLYSSKFQISSDNIEEVKIKIIDKIILHFSEFKNKIDQTVSRDKIDESQIIYSYIKNKNSNCKYAIVPRTWLTPQKYLKLSDALDKLIYVSGSNHSHL
jgi:excinuclease ABC subunit C